MRKTIITSLALAAACLAVSPAIAADAKLVWNDLDLSTDAGKTELDHRIDAAAEQVCNPGAVTGSRIARGASSSCLNEARTAIKAQIAAKTGKNRMAASTSGALAEAR